MIATLLASFVVPGAHVFLLNVTNFLQATMKSSLIPLQRYLKLNALWLKPQESDYCRLVW